MGKRVRMKTLSPTRTAIMTKTPKAKEKKTTTTKGESNVIELIVAIAETVAAILKNYKKIVAAWNKYRPPPK